jgi:predicted phage gp36 major capsid-like protein
VKRALSLLDEKNQETLKNESVSLTAWIASLIQKSFAETEEKDG